MKTVKSIRISLILLLILSGYFSKLSAQIDESFPPGMAATLSVPGYVILNNGDTLTGKIKWALKYVENNPAEIKFTSENGASKSFNASEIKGFGNKISLWMENNPKAVLNEMENYESMPSFKKGVPVFMNRLLSGKITIYQNRSAMMIGSSTTVTENTRFDGIGFTFISGEGLTIGPRYRTDYRTINGRTRYSSYYVLKNDSTMIKVDKDNYDSLFKALFGDCDQIDQELGKNPDLSKFKNFMILAEVYNRLCN